MGVANGWQHRRNEFQIVDHPRVCKEQTVDFLIRMMSSFEQPLTSFLFVFEKAANNFHSLLKRGLDHFNVRALLMLKTKRSPGVRKKIDLFKTAPRARNDLLKRCDRVLF